jgi:ribonuclease HII
MRDGRTVAEIAALLAREEVATELVAELKTDDRAAVGALLAKWERRQAAKAAEFARLEKLFTYEKAFYDSGRRLVAGVDEAGRGPLAGPVVVAAVILPPDLRLPGINDSKKLSAAQREGLYEEIRTKALAVSMVSVSVEEIDRINIYQATVKGMYQAVAALSPLPEAVLTDAVPLRTLTMPHQALIRGDALSASIAAASIIAKVERDRMMTALDAEYPVYGFARHKGYCTPDHLAALHRHGPCCIHRRSFAPVREEGSLFDEDYR